MKIRYHRAFSGNLPEEKEMKDLDELLEWLDIHADVKNDLYLDKIILTNTQGNELWDRIGHARIMSYRPSLFEFIPEEEGGLE